MSDTWGQQESEALRRVLAGDLPIPADEAVGIKTAKYVEKRVVNAIRHLQGVVADGKAAWLTASNKERARRAEEQALKCMRAGVMWQWQQAGIIEEQRRTRIARAWRRHRAMYNREEWRQHIEERRTPRALLVASRKSFRWLWLIERPKENTKGRGWLWLAASPAIVTVW